MDSKVKVILGYIFWPVALILFFVEKGDVADRVHYMQSCIIGIPVYIISSILSWIFWPISSLVGLCYLILVILCCIKANNGDIQVIPVVTEQAEKFAKG